ncbi:MAG: hypothetical protein OHK0023_15130 [Anaerolineae bacterium]
MSITVQWDDATYTVLRYTYTTRWTWADYEAAVTSAGVMVKADAQTNQLVDVIADFSQSAMLPDHALANFRRSLQSQNAIAFGVTVLVTHNQFMRSMIEVFGRLNRQVNNRLRVANSLEEARMIIANIRASTNRDLTASAETPST